MKRYMLVIMVVAACASFLVNGRVLACDINENISKTFIIKINIDMLKDVSIETAIKDTFLGVAVEMRDEFLKEFEDELRDDDGGLSSESQGKVISLNSLIYNQDRDLTSFINTLIVRKLYVTGDDLLVFYSNNRGDPRSYYLGVFRAAKDQLDQQYNGYNW